MRLPFIQMSGLEANGGSVVIEEECKYDVAAMYVFSMYGFNYMKKIVLRRADLNDHVIAERDFKYLCPSDFKDLYLLNLQGHLNHPLHRRQKDSHTLPVAVKPHTNLGWDARDLSKAWITVCDSPRAVTFRDKYGVQMIMRFNEIHKFSDGTLHRVVKHWI
ncbi:hypothetical protein Tco_1439608 [Tanacetum coccineum]